MDLLKLDLARKDRERKFTVLTRDKPWTDSEVNRLVHAIMNEVHQNPHYPGVLILCEEQPLEKIQSVVGDNYGEYKVLQDRANPELPFTPSM